MKEEAMAALAIQRLERIVDEMSGVHRLA